MLRLILYSVCVSLVWTLPFIKDSLKQRHLKDVGGRIIDGEEAALGQFPWQVATYFTEDNDSWWFCGGGIISDEWILTAGHCVIGAIYAEVYPGLVNFDDAVEIIFAEEFILHEGYDDFTLENDIGLVKLLKKLNFDDTIKAVALASEPLVAGVEFTVSGWGLTSNDADSISNVLNFITLTTIENTECTEAYNDPVFDRMVCATAGNNSIKSSCSGDSGGPVVTNPATDPVHVAIVSFGPDNGCETGIPPGFTRTYYYKDWIVSNTGIQLE